MPNHPLPEALFAQPTNGPRPPRSKLSKLHEVIATPNPVPGQPDIINYPWRDLEVGERFVIRRKHINEAPMPASMRSYASVVGRRLGCTFKVSNRGTGPLIYIMRVK